MKKQQALKTSIGLRKKFKKLYLIYGDYQKVAEETGATYWQVYNALNNRVKTKATARADKGKSRKKPEGEIDLNNYKSPDQFKSMEDFLLYILTEEIPKELADEKISVADKLNMFEKISRIQKNLHAVKLESWIRRPEAILIIKIMKRLNPDLTEEKMQKIYMEEYEKIQRDLT